MSRLRRILDTLPILSARIRGKAALFAAPERTRPASRPDNADGVVLTVRESNGVSLDLLALAEELDALAREGPDDQDQVA